MEGRVKAGRVSTFTKKHLGKTYNSNHNPAGTGAPW